jgi:hypothetical protein
MTESRIALPLAAAAALLGACAAATGEGPTVSVERPVGAFRHVRAEAGIRVVLGVGDATAGPAWSRYCAADTGVRENPVVTIRSAENLVDLIGTNLVAFERETGSEENPTMEDVLLEVSGDGIEPTEETAVCIALPAQPDLLSASSAEAGTDVILTGVNGGPLGLNASDGGRLEVDGTCDDLLVLAATRGAVWGRGLSCTSAELDVLDRSAVELTVTQRAVIRANGESRVTLIGAPPDVEETLQGDAVVIRE